MNNPFRIAAWVLIATIAVGLYWGLGVAESAEASAPCQATVATPSFVGYLGYQTSHVGVSASISTADSELCFANVEGPLNQDSYSAVWVMSQGPSPEQYAQAGYALIRNEGPSNGMAYYAEYRYNLNVPYVRKLSDFTISGTHTYLVRYIARSSYTKMKIDDKITLRTNFDPVQAWGSTSTWYPEYLGETHDHGDDIPGTQAPAYYDAIQILLCGGCSWTLPNVHEKNDYSTRYGVAEISASQFEVWTKTGH